MEIDIWEYLRASFRKHGALLLIQTLVAVANTVANVFALIYLIREGYDYIACSIFILVCCLVPLVLLTFASRILVKNFSASINTGLVCLIAYYMSLIALADIDLLGRWPLVLVPPLFFGTYIVTFWIPYNVLIMHITSAKKRGATIGLYFLIWPMITTVGPLIGGFIITLYSYDVMFLVAVAVLLVNLFYMSGLRILGKLRERIIIPELLQSITQSLVERRRTDLDFSGVNKGLMYGLFVEGIIDGVFWIAIPIISFQFATSEERLSQYLSLFALWGAVMTVALGYLSDKIRNRTMFLRAGMALTGVSMVIAAIAPTLDGYLSGMSLTYFFMAIIPAFLFTMLLEKLERYKKRIVILREFLLNVGRCVGVVFTIAILLLQYDLMVSVIVTGLITVTAVIVK
jgi:hypothetical protein